MSLSRLMKVQRKFSVAVSRRLFSSKVIVNPMSGILADAPVMPVISIDDPALAVPLAKSLQQGGFKVLEVALRTPHALSAITAIRKACPEMKVGAATVITKKQFESVMFAGAQFAASPLYCKDLMEFAKRKSFPYMPCVVTTREMNEAKQAGFDTLKLFPLDAMGDGANGEKFLSAGSTQAIFKELEVKCCSSKLVTDRKDINAYLRYPGVVSVVSGWSAPAEWVTARHWDWITQQAQEDLATAQQVLRMKR